MSTHNLAFEDQLPPVTDTVKAPVFTKVHKQNRTYVFPNYNKITLIGVDSIHVSKSGTHRLNTIDGKKHIIPPGWLHIEFVAEDWTF